MPRSRPASNPLSFHAPTGQHYVTRRGRRIYLGADHEEAIARYHRLALGFQQDRRVPQLVPARAYGRDSEPVLACTLTVKELANRFIAAQQANWRAPAETKCGYLHWLGRFLADHPRLLAADFTLEQFATWKLSLRSRSFAPKSIDHYLGAVRALFKFAEEAGLLTHIPRLSRVRNESKILRDAQPKQLYTPAEIGQLVAAADVQMKCMLLVALNCGFGPKDMHDVCWDHFDDERVVLARSKTGVSQVFTLWPETRQALADLAKDRRQRIKKSLRRGCQRTDGGRVFITKFWRPWNRDAVAEQFRKLCKRANVPCFGFYRLRHCASTAMPVFVTHLRRTVTPDWVVVDSDAGAIQMANSYARLLGTDISAVPGPCDAHAATNLRSQFKRIR
jgi:integrase